MATVGARHFLRRKALEVIRHVNEKTDNVIGILAVLLVLSIVAGHFHESHFKESVEGILQAFHIFIAVLVVLYAIGRFVLIKDPTLVWAFALTDEDCRNLRQWFRNGGEPQFELCGCMHEYASRRTLEALVELNYEGFKDSAFAVEKEKLEKRNPTWIARNPKVFMMMLDPESRKEFIGYSCLLPLNEDGMQLYLEGKLKDEDIPAALVAARGEPAAGVLIFAIVLSAAFSLTRSKARKEYSPYFWICILHHAVDLYADLYDANGNPPPIYAQTERGPITRRLVSLGFTKIPRVQTADGFDLWKLENPIRRPAKGKQTTHAQNLNPQAAEEDAVASPS